MSNATRSVVQAFGNGPNGLRPWSGQGRVTMVTVAAALVTGVLAAANLQIVAVLILASFAVALAAATQSHHDGMPVVVLIGISAAAALLFLPALRGEFGRRDEYELYGFALGGGIALAGVLAAMRRRLPIRLVAPGSVALDFLMIGFVGLAGISAVIGLSEGHRLTYIVSDTFRLLATAAAYWIAATSITNPMTLRHVFLAMAILLAIQQTRDGLTALAVIGSEVGGRITAVLWMQNLVAVFALVLAAASTRRALQRYIGLLLAILVFGVGMASGFRAYLALAVLGVLAVIAIQPRAALSLASRLGRPALIAAIAIVLVVAASPSLQRQAAESAELLVNRIDLIASGRADPSVAGRELEVDLVVTAVINDPATIPLGAGSGATFELPYYAGDYALQLAAANNFQVHNVHNSFASMGYRHGAVGAGMLIALFVAAIIATGRLARRSSDPITWLPFAGAIVFAGAAPFFFFVPGDVVFAILVGSAAGVNRSSASPLTSRSVTPA
jgi:hypothetical protein